MEQPSIYEKLANSAISPVLLNGWWEFQPIYGDAAEATLPREYHERILVPSFWNSFPENVGGDWGAYKNFNWPDEWDKAHAAAYRRMFPLPRKPDGKRLRLKFDAVLAQAEVFVNGVRVMNIDDGFLPFECDITDAVRWEGSNSIELLVHERPKKDDQLLRPGGSWLGWTLLGIWQDCSLQLVPEFRIADVFVMPSVRGNKVRVRVVIENQSASAAKLSVSTGIEEALAQAPKPPFPMTRARIRNYFAQVPFVSEDIDVPGRSSATAELQFSAQHLQKWSPESPKLYDLRTSVAQDSEPRTVSDLKVPLTRVHLIHAEIGIDQFDERTTRFGFKEFWIEGAQFMLNGVPIRFKGDSWHYMGAAEQTPEYVREWFRMVKSIGANCVRLHAMPHPRFFLDIADEMGVCIIDECAVYGSGGNLALKEEEFWDAAREHVRRFVRRDRNHPSVCLWSASNEVVWKGGPASYPGLLSLEQAIREEDPTRPVSFDENQSDLGGGAKVFAGHYGTVQEWATKWPRNKPLIVNEFSSLYYSGAEEPAKWGGETCFADFNARTAAAGEEAREMILGLRALGAASITPWNFIWYGLWPAYPKQAIELDPDPEASGIKTQRIGANSVSLNYEVTEGTRLDPGDPNPYEKNAAFDIMRSAYAPVASFIREQSNNFFEGDEFVRHIDVYNDVPRAQKLRVVAKFEGHDPVTTELEMQPYQHRLLVLRFSRDRGRPRPREDGSADLTIQTYASDQLAHTESQPIYIAQRRTDIPVCPVTPDETGKNACPTQWPERIALIDISGDTARALKRVGLKFERIDIDTLVNDVPEPDGLSAGAVRLHNRPQCIVIGRGEMQDTTLHDFATTLTDREFFAFGGVLVVLEGAFAADNESPLNPIHREYLRAWRRGHPEFWKDMPDDTTLRNWGQDGSVEWQNGPVAKHVFRKPNRGAFVPLAEVADAQEGLEFSPLLWLPLGNGGVVLNGFDLLANYDKHPVVAELLRKIVLYEGVPAEQRHFKQPYFDHVWCDEGDPIEAFSQSVGALVKKKIDDVPRVWALGSNSALLSDAHAEGKWRHLVEIGETFVLFDIGPDALHSAFAEELGLQDNASPVAGEVARGPWENVAKKHTSEAETLLSGISDDDLMWVRRGQSEPILDLGLMPSSEIAPMITTVPTRWAGYAEAAEQHKYAMMYRRMREFPGEKIALGEMKVGKGLILFCQMNLASSQLFQRKAQRIWAQLLFNLGVRFDDNASAVMERRSPFVDESGYIRRWLLLGVFGGGDANALLATDFVGGETAVEPREDAEFAGKKWRVYTAPEPAINLREGFAGEHLDNVIGYAAVYVFSPTSREIIIDTPNMVDFAFGSDDGARVWINGELILSEDARRSWESDQDRVHNVKLRRGWNLLLVKSVQYGWEWKISARFLTSRGVPVTDLRYALEPGRVDDQR